MENITVTRPLQVFIVNVHDNRIGGFTIPLPTTMEKLQPFLDGAEIKGWQDIGIIEVTSDIRGLGEALTETIRKTMSKDTLDELNFLAARVQSLQGGNGYEILAAVIETNRHNGCAAEIINLTFDENLNRFDLLPAFSNEQYGDFLIEQVGVDAHADAFNRLEKSDKPEDNELAKYIEKLEKYVDRTAYGRDAIKEENGVLTDTGLLMGGGEIQAIYHGAQDIPAEHRIFTEPGEIGKAPLKLDGVDIAAAVMKLHAVCNGNMDFAAVNLKTLLTGPEKDYLLLINRSDVCLSPVDEAYKRGTETAAFISLEMKQSAERPDFMAFAVRVSTRGENGITGDLIELNAKALCENISRHAVAPDRIDVVYSNGASKSYDLWNWAELPQYAKDDIRDYTPHYPDGGLSEAGRRYASFVGANETVSEAVGMDVFLPSVNAAYMAATKHPDPDMIRIGKDAAIEMLARGDADVYRLYPDWASKLTAIEGTRLSRQTGSFALAIKQDDISGLDKWAGRKVIDLMRSQERGERDKNKHKGEEL
jgi:hypothetical protein